MKLTKKRGFSLVELMVVVAIMGTLAAIAIPAYNEYRKSAKKTAYKTDLLGLHKGWLAFGVELDSFCERETQPKVASISTVGMQSLVSSKLYGDAATATCNSTVYGAGCSGCTVSGNTCTGTTSGCTTAADNGTTCTASAYTPASVGPGKENFIGFENATTDCSSAGVVQADIRQVKTTTTADPDCDLDVTEYKMGVYGHIAGKEFYGVSVNHNGVVSSEVIKDTTVTAADSGC